jgi:hypothetical protein
MSCGGGTNCSCGCCAGVGVQTPQAVSNLPGLSSIVYRTGTWVTFRESMHARLSSSDYPALARLKTRDSDDFTVAVLDAAAVVLDILTFYQERLANESYLRTAGQLRSLTELGRLIDYQPAPGVSASAYLAFSLVATPGLTPDPSTPAISIPAGTQAQSIPAQGQQPQTFETLAPIQAKADWHAQPVQTGGPWSPAAGDTSVYLAGTSTQLQPGDIILIVGDERGGSTSSKNWDVRLVTTVTSDAINQRTYVEWSEGLGSGGNSPAAKHPKFHAFRQRAALFGYNAADPNLLSSAGNNLKTLVNMPAGEKWTWILDPPSGNIDLDSAYPKIVTGSWLVMIKPDKQTSRSPAGYIGLYLVTSVSPVARSGFGMSAKITRVVPDADIGPTEYPLGTTIVLAQSDELDVAEQPLPYPLYGTYLDLENPRPDLVGIQAVALSGKRQKISVNSSAPAMTFVPDDGSAETPLNPGDLLTITDPSPLPLNPDGTIPDWASAATLPNLYVQDSNGRPGVMRQVALSSFTLALAAAQDPDVEECALVSAVTTLPTAQSAGSTVPHTLILLQSTLLNCYDRTVTTVNANVGLATHGQSVSEVMGSGSAATPNQNFTLKQSPLTFIQAITPTGRQSTLQVRANAMAWTEVPGLYGQGPSQQVFATLNQPDGTTDVLFGDGVEGATLPTGVNNIIANYRIGSGAAGNVAAGAISTLLDRPLGVSGVNNPQAATGGHDAQTTDGIRGNAPQTVLTLGRAVSIADYQNFAATFAGIAKASAIWIPGGPARGVFLTVAGVNGAALPPGNPSLTNLVMALRNYGNPRIPINAQSFLETLFGLSADLKYDPAYDQPTVRTQVLQTLSAAYSFANRTFGQGVSADEVAAVTQAVPGVVAVNVTGIYAVATSAAGDLASEGPGFSLSRYSAWLSQSFSIARPDSGSPTRISPYVPVATPQALPYPAEILVLDPDPAKVVLGLMS